MSPFISQQRNMLGDNPERSFLGGAKIQNILSNLSFYCLLSVTFPFFINFTSFLCRLTRG